MSLEAWRGIAVPKGTPADDRDARERDPLAAENPAFAKASEKLGVRPAYLPAAQFGELIAKEDGELARLMETIGLKK